MPASRILVLGTVRLPPGRLDAARPAMAAMIAASRLEDGCLEYTYAEDVLEAGLIHVKEAWRDREALRAHFESPHLHAWRATWEGLGISDRHLFLYEADGIEKV
jgi:quinol monooxygenase YgiN